MQLCCYGLDFEHYYLSNSEGYICLLVLIKTAKQKKKMVVTLANIVKLLMLKKIRSILSGILNREMYFQ